MLHFPGTPEQQRALLLYPTAYNFVERPEIILFDAYPAVEALAAMATEDASSTEAPGVASRSNHRGGDERVSCVWAVI